MKHYLHSILILLASCCQALACGFYPYGEDIRFSMYKPDVHLFRDYAAFYYSAHYFEPVEELTYYAKDKVTCAAETYENILLWRKRYHNIPSAQEVLDAVYSLDRKELKATSSNGWIRLLFAQKDTSTIAYLDFAKSCDNFNTRFEDPWERHAYASSSGRVKLIAEAEKRIDVLQDKELIKRYAFLCIRLAHYNGNENKVRQIYEQHFSSQAPKDAIDYWSMYFRCLAETEPSKINYYAAQVFAHSPGKRFSVCQQYVDSIAVTETLQWANTPDEKSAVWLMTGIKNPNKVLDCMEHMYAADPSSEGLSFLLLREINKLEDWIYTPYYTDFSPSISNASRYEDNFYEIYEKRLAADRAYAKKVLTFVNRALKSGVYHPGFWKNTKAYLLLMTQQYPEALTYIQRVQQAHQPDTLLAQKLAMLKAFCLTALQPKGQAVLLPIVKQTILTQVKEGNYRFVFAIARELEFKGNTTDAAVLLSNINQSELPYDDDSWRSDIFWRTKNGSYMLYGNFYTSYFDYIDFMYTPSQVNELIQRVAHHTETDPFNKWAYQTLKKDRDLLLDLLGTKYIRQNKLSAALEIFKQLPDSVWKNERYAYLDANPFYTNVYNQHQKTEADTIAYNKYTLTKTLMQYIHKANDPKTKDRDYYYFLVANCYLNMTYYGNSWYMKRYSWTAHLWVHDEYMDEDFGQCLRAKAYYLKAKQHSKTDQFAALCLRMAGRCEKYRLMSLFKRKADYDYFKDTDDKKLFDDNKYYAQLKTEYPIYYDDLISNCEAFGTYFLARR
ncbi:MAG: hypothetical protein JWM14_3372 [Chitinophagaceae bacterium]|nr:hypothetical protein [Chitinophagaceae bacterium]